MSAKVLTENEVKRVLAILRDERHSERNRCAFMLSYLAGMRAIEICSTKISDLYDEQGDVKREIRLQACQTKGSHSRVIVVSERLAKELSRYQAFLQLSKKWKMSAPAIQSQKGTSFSANSLVQLFGRIYQQAGLSGASSHSGRRTFITELASKGVSARVLQKLAGHSSLNTTQRYIDVNDKMLMEAVNLI